VSIAEQDAGCREHHQVTSSQLEDNQVQKESLESARCINISWWSWLLKGSVQTYVKVLAVAVDSDIVECPVSEA
jgi:hypothetical protein